MRVSNLSTIVFTVLVLTAACKKDDEPTINSCLNGQLDSGETAVDCGGACGPCPSTEFPSAGWNVYTTAISAETKQLTYTDRWMLHLANDSISMNLNLGNNGAVGTYTMDPAGSNVTYNGITYTNLTSGVFSISWHNTTTHKMSGFFHGKFIRPAVPGDTLRITNGFFEYLPY